MKEFFKSQRKVTALITVVLFVMIVFVSGTLALLSDRTDGKVNTFTKGNVKTELVEKFVRETDQIYEKEPRVANTGANDCYVRVRLELTPVNAKDNVIISDFGEQWQKVGDGDDSYNGWYYYTTVLPVQGTTEPLFKKVAIMDLDNWVDFDIILYQEAVLAERDDEGNVITDMETIMNSFSQYN